MAQEDNLAAAAYGNYSTAAVSTLAEPALDADMLFGPGHRVQLIGNSILMTISSLENLTILVLLCVRRPMTRMTSLLISLTISDLLVTFLTMPLEIGWAYTVQWLADDSTCKLMMVGRIMGLYSSSFNLVAISIDRYCIIMYPFTNMTTANKRVKFLLIGVWTSSALCALPQAVVFRKQYHPKFPTFGQCATFNSFPSPQLEMAYNVFVTLMLFILPLILFCIFYGRLWFYIRRKQIMTSQVPKTTNPDQPASYSQVHLLAPNASLRIPPPTTAPARRLRWQSSKQSTQDMSDHMLGQSMRFNSSSNSATPNIYMRAKSKSFKMAITLVIVFLICWVPYYCVSCWFWFDKESLRFIDERIIRTLFIFAVSQSCLNPIVTGIFCLRLDRKLASLNCCRPTLRSSRLPSPPTPATAPAAARRPSNHHLDNNGHHNHHPPVTPPKARCNR